jgi:periplasmic protein TonB
MYKYEQPSIFSGPRGAALIAVIILHILIVWAFYTGLAGKLIQKVIPPVEIAQIEKPKEVDKPPPPPPKLEEIKPFVPPPEFVDIQQAPAQTNAITETTNVKQAPAPVAPPAPVQHNIVRAAVDPKHPFPNSEDYYPDSSRRAGEEGRCIVEFTVATDGRIADPSVTTSSGHPKLDEACIKLIKAAPKLKPATEDGKPIESKLSVPIVWKLHQ